MSPSMDVSFYAAGIIVAAGKGVRMGTSEKKQYLRLGSHPVLAHTLAAFARCEEIGEIVLVIAAGEDARCEKEIIDVVRPGKPVRLVSGGPSRQASVFHGLKATDGRFDVVAIHDGARPLIKPGYISRCIRGAAQQGACILAVPATDTVKTIDKAGRITCTMKRDEVRLAQTPQAFRYSTILKAHEAARRENYEGTDDAELVERYIGAVATIPGDRCNIKITTAEDLKVAELFLESSNE